MTLEQMNEHARLRRELEQAVNLKAAMEEAVGLKADVIAFIDTIPDIQTRTICRLRFLGGFTWTWIAVVIGGGNTAYAVKKRCYRYLRQ